MKVVLVLSGWKVSLEEVRRSEEEEEKMAEEVSSAKGGGHGGGREHRRRVVLPYLGDSPYTVAQGPIISLWTQADTEFILRGPCLVLRWRKIQRSSW